MHFSWVARIPWLISPYKSHYDATLLLFILGEYSCENIQQRFTRKTPFFAGWHDLGVQKHKISKEMTQKEKGGQRTVVKV